MIEQLLKLVCDTVSANGNWLDKKQKILAEASESDVVWLEEFVGWFSEEEHSKENNDE
jgi:hypothetical protein